MFAFILLVCLCGLMYLFRNKLKKLFKSDVASVENKVNQAIDPAKPAAVNPAPVEPPKQ